MIPDFPEVKERLMKALNNRLQRKHKEYLGIFSEVPGYAHHEGSIWAITNDEGIKREQDYKTISSELLINLEEIPDMVPSEILARVDKVAEDSARLMHAEILEEITKATDEAGTAIDAKGKPLDQDMFLSMLDRMDLEFDEKGELIPPAIVMHPKLWEAKGEELKSWEEDGDFIAKHRQLMHRKREEWRAREARRKLVD